MILGIAIVLVGKFRLAQYVQRLPTCVMGGYLAYIGWFCGASGVQMMLENLAKETSWYDTLLHVLPGVLGGIFLYIMVHTWGRIHSILVVLPTCMTILILGFYGALFATGTSFQEATNQGWFHASSSSSSISSHPIEWYDTWQYLRLDLVVWSALPSQGLTLLGMVFMVALGSSLDIAAIDMELGALCSDDGDHDESNKDEETTTSTTASTDSSISTCRSNAPHPGLDYNKELITVGWSNAISGLCGGYTGSYIFSVSTWTLRYLGRDASARVAGLVLAFCEALFVMLPVDILVFVPTFFLASLLVLFCVQLMKEWLWDTRTKQGKDEYVVGWITFFVIQGIGIEYGIVVGVVVYLVWNKLVIVIKKKWFETPSSPGETTTLMAQVSSPRRRLSLTDHSVMSFRRSTSFQSFQVNDTYTVFCDTV